MSIIANNRREHSQIAAARKHHISATTCKCGERLHDHLELLGGRCFACMCQPWEGIAEDALR